MRKLLVIGIGVGHPGHLTLQAIEALNRADVIFVMDKGSDTADLRHLRQEMCARHIRGHAYRFIELPDPKRDADAPSYLAGVDDWHARRAAILQRLIAEELAPDGTGAFLVWGDPSLYDSTLRVIDLIVANDSISVECEVIPGIGSVQALAAAHRIVLNPIGGAVLITTGRRLREGGLPPEDTMVVMLDAANAFAGIPPEGWTIHWGAYLGTEREILIAGSLADVAAQIVRARAEARERHGWIMDTYLLRRGDG